MMIGMQDWLSVDESAKSFLTRTLSLRVPPLTSVPPLHRVPLHAGHVLEIAGSSGSAKSELLLQAAVACILPKEVDGIHYGGSEGVVIMFDLDCHFDMLRLTTILQHRIKEARAAKHEMSNIVPLNSKEGDVVLMSCLRRFLYTRCYSSFEFLAALKTLHAKIKRLNESGIHPNLLMIDSINAFFWIDRAVSSSFPAGPEAGRTALSLHVVSEAVVKELNHVLETHPLLILTTKSLIHSLSFGDRKNATQDDFTEEKETKFMKTNKATRGTNVNRDFMPAVWKGFVTHRVILQGPFQPEGAYNCLPFYIAKWESPCFDQLDKFVIQNSAITLVR